jgi:hypothetical protein
MQGIFRPKNSAIRRVLTGLVIVCLMVAPLKAVASLRLIAEHGGIRFEKFEVSNGAIVIDGLAPGADGVVWRLEGDLKQEHQAVLFDPYYSLVARVAIPGLAREKTGHLAVVSLDHSRNWKYRELDDAVIVVVWWLDGQVKHLRVIAGRPWEVSKSGILAMEAIELEPGEEQGRPFVLAWRKGAWIQPKPLFDDPLAQTALAEMHLGNQDEFERAVAALKSVNVRTRSERTLLHLAAESGLVDATRRLIARGAKIDGEQFHRTPLHAAAGAGRLAVVQAMLLAKAKERRGGGQYWPFDWAIRGRHVAVVAALAAQGNAAKRARAVELALQQGDADTALELASGEKLSLPRKSVERLWLRVLEFGDPLLVSAMEKISGSSPPKSELEVPRPIVPDAELAAAPKITFRSTISAEWVTAWRGEVKTVPGVAVAYGPYGPESVHQVQQASHRVVPGVQDEVDSRAVLTAIVEPDDPHPSVIEVEHASSELFGRLAAEAVRKYKISPARKDGQAVRARLTIVVHVGGS